MNICIKDSYTTGENNLFKRFKANQSTELTKTEKIIMDNYSDVCFSPAIFRLLVQDIIILCDIKDNPLSDITSIINFANKIAASTGFIRAEKLFAQALIPIWISYCTEYKNYGYTYRLKQDVRGLRINQRAIHIGISENCFNCLFCPSIGKIKIIENFYFHLYKDCFRNREMSVQLGDLEFKSLIAVMNYTGFKYIAPVCNLRSHEVLFL